MLTEIEIQQLDRPGKHPVGVHRLYVDVMPTGGKSYVWQGRIGGKRVNRGLGSVVLVSLAEAVRRAEELEAARGDGGAAASATSARGEPEALVLAGGRRSVSVVSRSSAALVAAGNAPSVRDAAFAVWQNLVDAKRLNANKHIKRWMSLMETYVFPWIGQTPVDVVGAQDVVALLRPIQYVKPETAKRVAQQLESIFAWAIAMAYRESNPAAVKTLAAALPRAKQEVSHMRSLPWQGVPAWYAKLVMVEGFEVVGRALRMMILTMVRPGEVRGATWDEVDLAEGVWQIPASRMKMKRDHRVPLCRAAVDVFKEAWAADGRRGLSLVFPHPHQVRMLSENFWKARFDKLGLREYAVAHGFRSSGRTWLAETRPDVPWEIAEVCLAHEVGSAVSQAYMRSDYLEERRPVMEAWGAFVESELSVPWR